MLARDNLYQSCQPIFTNNQLDLELGGFALRFAPTNTKLTFRDIDWGTRLDELEELFDSTDQSIAFGVNSVEQLGVLKNHFSNRAVTISCSYDRDFYNTMLEYYVDRHLYLQNIGVLEITKHDQTVRDSGVYLRDYYIRAFDAKGIVPESIDPVGERDIPIPEFFNSSAFFHRMALAGAIPTIETRQYYDQWRNTLLLQGTQI
jgi:hypothetical protein